MELPQQLRIAGYDIQRQIGRGSLGVVYQAWDRPHARTVALRMISAARPGSEGARADLERRFLAEMASLSAVSHAAIASVHEAGIDARTRTPFLAVEHLRGRTLASMLAARHSFEWADAVRIIRDMADAVHDAHTRGIVHGDIKPANIMLLKSGGSKVMDFALATLFRPDPAGGPSGRPSYMSPEQALGEVPSARSDVFSLAVVLYELLTRTPAFAGDNPAEILTRVIREDPSPATGLVAGLPAAAQDVLSRGLAKEPGHRYPDAAAFRDDLEDLVESRPPRHGKTIVARPGPPATRVRKPADIEARKGLAGDAQDRGLGTARTEASGPALGLPPGKRVGLAILDGPRRGDVIELDRPKAIIGRMGGKAQADIELDDEEVSRAHVLVECHGLQVIVRDLASTNGTFVEERRVAESHLHNGGELRVGRTRIRLVISDVEA
jgi:hypothetical protein